MFGGDAVASILRPLPPPTVASTLADLAIQVARRAAIEDPRTRKLLGRRIDLLLDRLTSLQPLMSLLSRLFAIFHHPTGRPVMTLAIVSATLDKPSYTKGETATLTVVRTDSSTVVASQATSVGTVTETDTATAETTTLAFDLLVDTVTTTTGASTVAVTDDAGRVWTQVSDDGGTAVLTATV